MVLVRPAALRAPLARFARPATRTSPWSQTFQRTARRGYASAGDVAQKASSDLPWLAAGIVVTVPSVYYILSSIETGGHHDESHGDHGEEHHEEEEKKEEPESKDEESKSEDSEEKDGKDNKKSEGKEDDKTPSDKPTPRKEPKSSGTSGKQEGISNADTKHSTDVANDPNKSSKGEGVAETAKLKGTVSSERPGAESAQKGQAVQDKSK